MLAISAWMQFVQIAFFFFIVGAFTAIAWMFISETRLRVYRHQRNRRTTIPARFATRDLPPAVVRARSLERGWKLLDGPHEDGRCILTKDDAIVWLAHGSHSGESPSTDLAFLGASVARDRSGDVNAAVSSLLDLGPTAGGGSSAT